MVRYTFIVRDSHPLLLAGLPAHSRVTRKRHPTNCHSITSSARTKNASGTVIPSALAVLRLTTNEALPQTDEVYAEDGALIAIANDKVDSDRACRDDALNIRARSSVGRKTRGRPESGMSVARSVADVLRDHVVLELEAIDRMYLNVYVPHLQTVGAVVGYLRVHRGQRFASTTAVVPMSEAFVRNIEQFVDDEAIDLVSFEKRERKDDVTQRYLRSFRKREGVLYVGKAQEKARVMRTERRSR